MATTEPPSEQEPAPTLPDPLVDALVQTAFATMAVLNRISAENDLSLTQLRVLAILRDRRLRVTELAAHLGLEKSTLSGLVDRAAKRGLLERRADAVDGRAVDVVLTPDGVRLAARLGEQLAQALAPSTAALSPAEQSRLRVLLGRMLGAGAPITPPR